MNLLPSYKKENNPSTLSTNIHKNINQNFYKNKESVANAKIGFLESSKILNYPPSNKKSIDTHNQSHLLNYHTTHERTPPHLTHHPVTTHPQLQRNHHQSLRLVLQQIRTDGSYAHKNNHPTQQRIANTNQNYIIVDLIKSLLDINRKEFKNKIQEEFKDIPLIFHKKSELKLNHKQ